MKYRIRINGEIKEIDCELGSGVLDKNGREIFEGDTIRYYNKSSTGKILFSQGNFCVTRMVNGVECLPFLLEVNAIFKDIETVDD